MRVLVTGGAGYIGSHAVRALLDAGHEVTALDDLSHGHADAVDPRAELIEAPTSDPRLAGMLSARGVEAVMHFAAFIEVGESVREPSMYYENNFANGLKLLKSMRQAGVRKLVFSSTAAVYGNPASTPITEDQERRPINPYGRSKMMMEMAVEDSSAAHGLGYAVLRYFNVAGAIPDGSLGERHEPESHLIPNVLAAAAGRAEAVRVFGSDYPTRDGTCVRDYVHVMDLVDAHLLALERITPGAGDVFNLGSESGYTVLEVVRACEAAAGRAIPVRMEPRRPGDPAVLVASNRKARAALGWRPRYSDLAAIVGHAWAWHAGAGGRREGAAAALPGGAG